MFPHICLHKRTAEASICEVRRIINACRIDQNLRKFKKSAENLSLLLT